MPRPQHAPFLALLLSSCAYISDKEESERLDPDGDGVLVGEDCDDLDEDVTGPGSFWADEDGDGFGSAGRPVEACTRPDGATDNDLDCNDTSADVSPDADEQWYDGIDQDCSGGSDFDQDRDGVDALEQGGEDCDDLDPDAFPGAEEQWYDGIDQDCAGDDDFDQDADGWRQDEDCDDTDRRVSPGEEETWYNGIDEDCDGNDDDQDMDGHGVATDCEDTIPEVNPGATEVCNDGADNDCSGEAVACRIRGTLPASSATAEWGGTEVDAYAGFSVAGRADLDGDGLPELIIGEPGSDLADSYAGAAWVVDPPASSGLLSGAGTLLHGSYDDYAGYAVAGLSDQNGDGYDEAVIAAPQASDFFLYSGVVYVVNGPITGRVPLRSGADAQIWGIFDGAFVGSSIAPAGDHNGDGIAELLVGAPYDSTWGPDAGRAFLVSGPLTGLVDLSFEVELAPEDRNDDGLGQGLVADADFNADGQTDIAIGAPSRLVGGSSDVGSVYVLAGPVTTSVDLGGGGPAVRFEGSRPGTNLGYSLAAGDLNGGGYDDLVMSGHGWSDSSDIQRGALWVVNGPGSSGGRVSSEADAALQGSSQYSWFSQALSSGSDVDGDGMDDLLVGAPGETSSSTSQPGAAWLVYGPLSGVGTVSSGTGARINGGHSGSSFGWSVALPGDVDGDGHGDALVGSPEWSTGSYSYLGAAYLFLGAGM